MLLGAVRIQSLNLTSSSPRVSGGGLTVEGCSAPVDLFQGVCPTESVQRDEDGRGRTRTETHRRVHREDSALASSTLTDMMEIVFLS